MWNRKDMQTSKGLTVLIGEGCEVGGPCRFTGETVVNGHLTGDVSTDGTLLVGERGTITANVRADTLIVRGHITGDIIVTGRVELESTAHVVGNIDSPALVVREGAIFEGHSQIARVRPEGDLGSSVIPLAREAGQR